MPSTTINHKWALYLFRRDIEHMVEDTLTPIILHRYALIAQDDVEIGPPSWSWGGSWETRIDTMGRETWFTESSPASTQAKRNFVVLLPYQPDTQSFDPRSIVNEDRLVYIDADTGIEYGEFKTNLIRDTLTHVEIHVELIQ